MSHNEGYRFWIFGAPDGFAVQSHDNKGMLQSPISFINMEGKSLQNWMKCAVDITPDQDGGVLKEILVEGSGQSPGIWDEVTVHYSGFLLDGTKVDSSYDRGEPVTFKLDDGRVIRGWDVAMVTMKTAERCRLLCNPDYAYEKGGSPPNIPPHSPLIFDMELLSWKSEDLSKKGGITRRVLVKGSGTSHPNSGATVTVDVRGYYDDEIFDDRYNLCFKLGDGKGLDIPPGVEKALKKFRKGERSELSLTSQHAFGSDGHDKFSIPPNSDLRYILKLKDFTKAKEQWEMTPEEKLQLSQQFKAKGTELVKAENYTVALRKYKKGRELMGEDPAFSEQELHQRGELLLALNLNCALCELKLKQWSECRQSCNSAIALDSQNEKAFYRKAQALAGMNDMEEAVKVFEEVLKLNPGNKSARIAMTEGRKKLKQIKNQVKQTYHGMFDRFAADDAQKIALEKARGLRNKDPIGHWSNDMAAGMMSLQQELEAFGEKMPDKPRRSSKGDLSGLDDVPDM